MSKSKLILTLGLIAIISVALHKFNEGSICLFHNIYGIPCPTCGMTRAYSALLELDFKKAFMYHPLFCLVPLLVLSYGRKKYFYGIAGIFIFVWLIRMFLYFPNKEPLKFNKNAIFPKIYNTIIKK